jgi:hypothetical protein
VLAEGEDVEAEPVGEGGVADDLIQALTVSVGCAGGRVGLDVAEGDDAEFHGYSWEWVSWGGAGGGGGGGRGGGGGGGGGGGVGGGGGGGAGGGRAGRRGGPRHGVGQVVVMLSLPRVPPAKSASAVGTSSRV